MRDFSRGVTHLALNTATLRRQLPLDAIIEACARESIAVVDPWRDQVQAVGLAKIARQLKCSGVALSGYCRGGFFPARDAAGLRAAIADNRTAIAEAKELGAPCLIVVAGSLPGALEGKPQSHDLALARAQVFDGLAATLEHARRAQLPLAIEPLHPMQAAERACINTLRQALDICDALDPEQSGAIGIAVDAYHTWWDPELATQIARAGRRRLLAYHVSDWLVPTRDTVHDRGMMGDGVIELRKLRLLLEEQGYAGAVEVEIFSEHWWSRPADEVLATLIDRFKKVV
jgi:sugar phosphate isomerase/epimerase